MPLIETPDQVFSVLFIWLLGLIITEKVRRKFGVKRKLAYALYIWHTFFCMVYIFYLQDNLADASAYYHHAKTGEVVLGMGHDFVAFFASLFVIPFHLSFLGIFLLFNIFGYLGLLAWYGSLNIITKNKPLFVKRLALVTVFLPSVSFWTSALGKDSLAFMATGFALWAALNLKKRIPLMIFAIVTMAMVRPHIAGIFVISLALAFIFDKKIRLHSRLLLLILSSMAIAIIIPFAIRYVGLENASQGNDVLDYIEKRQSYNQKGGGGIDISSMSLPVQLFTFEFRPLPFEAHSISQLFAAIDNSFLLILFLLFLKGMIKKGKWRNNQHYYNMVFIVSFTMFTWLILAMTIANSGIAVRQKWMFTPFLVFLFFLYIGRPKKVN